MYQKTDLKANQLRCGEHTDYGALTILFQDSMGGLEVFNRQGRYVPAPPIPDTVVVNLGDLMQRWTADVLVSTVFTILLIHFSANANPNRPCSFAHVWISRNYPATFSFSAFCCVYKLKNFCLYLVR